LNLRQGKKKNEKKPTKSETERGEQPADGGYKSGKNWGVAWSHKNRIVRKSNLGKSLQKRKKNRWKNNEGITRGGKMGNRKKLLKGGRI